MPKRSAGLLLFRYRDNLIEVFLVHPGGPFWANKDLGSWSIPKGEYEEDEDPLAAAQREFEEETGFPVEGEFIRLDPVRQPSGKIVQAYAVEGDVDTAGVKSNLFSMEWPRKSGRQREFPEVDQAAWLSLEEARKKILSGQAPLLDELVEKLAHVST